MVLTLNQLLQFLLPLGLTREESVGVEVLVMGNALLDALLQLFIIIVFIVVIWSKDFGDVHWVFELLLVFR